MSAVRAGMQRAANAAAVRGVMWGRSKRVAGNPGELPHVEFSLVSRKECARHKATRGFKPSEEGAPAVQVNKFSKLTLVKFFI
mmetsp:Transcript_17588/g.32335  ORF Transcript_17588/g.32335 Transcript_17588/m.32335 type:complete len:83 (-) Transcript_17588:143-391(-)